MPQGIYKHKKHSEATRKKMKEVHKGIPKSLEQRKKQSETCKKLKRKMNLFAGKKHSENTKNKLKLINSRENHPNWLGGKSLEGYDINFNKTFKKLIKLRDNACVLCGANEKLIIHHIDYNKLNSIPKNCVTLCHGKTNFNRKHWIKFFQSLLSEKYGYKYEELIICQ